VVKSCLKPPASLTRQNVGGLKFLNLMKASGYIITSKMVQRNCIWRRKLLTPFTKILYKANAYELTGIDAGTRHNLHECFVFTFNDVHCIQSDVKFVKLLLIFVGGENKRNLFAELEGISNQFSVLI